MPQRSTACKASLLLCIMSICALCGCATAASLRGLRQAGIRPGPCSTYNGLVTSNICWNFAFDSDKEQGYFVTLGKLVNGVAPAGTYNLTVSRLRMTQSTFDPNLVGKLFTETQPQQGFIWNGTHVTQFFRSSGQYTNGANYFYGGWNLLFIADVTNGAKGIIRDPLYQNPNTTGFQPLSVTAT